VQIFTILHLHKLLWTPILLEDFLVLITSIAMDPPW